MEWYEIKRWVAAASGLDMDSLHVHVGVLAQIAVAALLRRRISSAWPWLAVAAAAFGNEVYDFQLEKWPTRQEQFLESVTDLWNTMLLPTVLLLLARFAPGLFARPSADAGKAGESRREAGE
ncbi:MAG TPA: hypothetical protein VGB70_04255 [Allosphingosinicella sp.]|jgi:hypothetical protein